MMPPHPRGRHLSVDQLAPSFVGVVLLLQLILLVVEDLLPLFFSCLPRCFPTLSFLYLLLDLRRPQRVVDGRLIFLSSGLIVFALPVLGALQIVQVDLCQRVDLTELRLGAGYSCGLETWNQRCKENKHQTSDDQSLRRSPIQP